MSEHNQGSSKKKAPSPRVAWLDEHSQTPLIDDYGKRLGGFLEAISDGHIQSHELKDQEARLVALMKTIEPKLNDELHAEVTELLCELTAYNIMQTIHDLAAAAVPKTKFRG